MSKCVRCGTGDDLVQYTFTRYSYVRSGRKKVIPGQETVEIKEEEIVPACSKCSNEFKQWDLKNGKVRNSKKIAFILYLLTILTIITSIGSPEFWPIAVIFGVITCFLVAYRVKFTKKSNELDYNPHKYMMFGMNNKFLIKPENYNQWIDYDKYMGIQSQVDINNILINEIINPIKRTSLPEEYQIIIEKLIFKIMYENKGKAFTLDAVRNRIKPNFKALGDSFYQENKAIINISNIEWVLDSMASQKKIIRKQRYNGIYYFID